MTGIIDFGLPILVSGAAGGGGIVPLTPTSEFLDYIFQFPSQGAYQGDPVIQFFAPGTLGTQSGVQLLVYNPVETLSSPALVANSMVLPPQQANSTVPLPGFWAMITLKGTSSSLTNHPNLQIINNRTFMFAQQPSVVFTKIDVSHINLVINIFGVYVRDGLQLLDELLLEDDVSGVLLEDGQRPFELES